MLLAVLWSVGLKADDRQPNYLCELGLQAGCGYYVGDAAPHIFMHPREAYGLHFRYKFTPRWALQVKGLSQRITGWDYDEDMNRQNTRWENQLVNIDVMGEFNFFRFGGVVYDQRVKQLSPYIFLGIGATLYGGENSSGEYKPMSRVTAYVPLGIGLKWKFSPRVGLNLAWQHNIYFTDGLEGRETLSDLHELNGSNWFNCDLTGQLTLGMVFEFGKETHHCVRCEYAR
ncbi:MAG: hypothetical protein IK073_05750 [Paludibacteraceae bacterium]|nr:hypothetical protein [Paludibacteraceae bacterium]